MAPIIFPFFFGGCPKWSKPQKGLPFFPRVTEQFRVVGGHFTCWASTIPRTSPENLARVLRSDATGRGCGLKAAGFVGALKGLAWGFSILPLASEYLESPPLKKWGHDPKLRGQETTGICFCFLSWCQRESITGCCVSRQLKQVEEKKSEGS